MTRIKFLFACIFVLINCLIYAGTLPPLPQSNSNSAQTPADKPPQIPKIPVKSSHSITDNPEQAQPANTSNQTTPTPQEKENISATEVAPSPSSSQQNLPSSSTQENKAHDALQPQPNQPLNIQPSDSVPPSSTQTNNQIDNKQTPVNQPINQPAPSKPSDSSENKKDDSTFVIENYDTKQDNLREKIKSETPEDTKPQTQNNKNDDNIKEIDPEELLKMQDKAQQNSSPQTNSTQKPTAAPSNALSLPEVDKLDQKIDNKNTLQPNNTSQNPKPESSDQAASQQNQSQNNIAPTQNTSPKQDPANNVSQQATQSDFKSNHPEQPSSKAPDAANASNDIDLTQEPDHDQKGKESEKHDMKTTSQTEKQTPATAVTTPASASSESNETKQPSDPNPKTQEVKEAVNVPDNSKTSATPVQTTSTSAPDKKPEEKTNTENAPNITAKTDTASDKTSKVQVSSQKSLDPEVSKFANAELIFLLLQEDEVYLGKTSESALNNLMSGEEYIQRFVEQMDYVLDYVKPNSYSSRSFLERYDMLKQPKNNTEIYNNYDNDNLKYQVAKDAIYDNVYGITDVIPSYSEFMTKWMYAGDDILSIAMNSGSYNTVKTLLKYGMRPDNCWSINSDAYQYKKINQIMQFIQE